MGERETIEKSTWHETVSPNTIRQAIQNLLSDPLERQAMARCGRMLIDGRGPDRLVTALEVMLHPLAAGFGLQRSRVSSCQLPVVSQQKNHGALLRGSFLGRVQIGWIEGNELHLAAVLARRGPNATAPSKLGG